eukprot:1500004-Rhodomonas_salina.1
MSDECVSMSDVCVCVCARSTAAVCTRIPSARSLTCGASGDRRLTRACGAQMECICIMLYENLKPSWDEIRKFIRKVPYPPTLLLCHARYRPSV